MHSCIYEGTVTHRRREPVTHAFQYRLFMVWLDLDELPSLVGPGRMIAASRHATRAFLRGDHLFDRAAPLDREVRGVIRDQTGRSPDGPIRLLTQLRYFGFYLSPLNLFFVYDRQGARVEYVVAEVNNTPWNERHCYVLWDGNRVGDADEMQFSHAKDFHVSPFMGMDMEYQWRISEPGERLTVQLANRRDSRELFDAGLALRRLDLNPRQLRRMTLRYPLMTARISSAIYYQALKLWWKKCPFYTHPKRRSDAPSPTAIPTKPLRKTRPVTG